MPAIGSEEESPSQDQKTQVVTADQLPVLPPGLSEPTESEASQATAQVDASAVAKALGKLKAKKSGGDPKATAFGMPKLDDKEASSENAAAAWGLDGATDAEQSTATQVVSPNDLNFGETPDSYYDQPNKPSAEKERMPEQFGTLMGFSLEERSDEEDAAGTMSRGNQETGGDVDGATQALSPDQLAKIDSMEFSMDFEESDAEEEPEAEIPRLRPGRKSQSTPVMEASRDRSNFEGLKLPRPARKPEDSEVEQVERPRSSTSPSGVLRSARSRRRRKESGGVDQSGPSTDSISRSGPITGTGTYSAKSGEVGTGRESLEPSLKESDLKLGGVGSGAKTAFSTGGVERQQVGEAVSTDAGPSDLGSSREASSSPVAQQSAPSPSAEEVPHTGEIDVEGIGAGLLDDFSIDDIPLDWGGADEGEDSQEPRLVDVEPLEVEPEPVKVEPQPLEAELESVEVEPVQPEPVQPEAVQPEPVQPEAVQPEPVQPEPGPAAPVSRPGDVQMPTHRPGGEPSDSGGVPVQPFGGGDLSFGAEPANPQGAEQPAQSHHQPHQPQVAPSHGQANAQNVASPAPAEQPADEASKTDRLVGLIQKGFGLMAGLLVLILAGGAVAVAGLPEDSIGLGVVGATGAVGVLACLVVVLPLKGSGQSIGFLLLSLLAVGLLLAGAVVGVEAMLVLPLFAGALMLFGAALFPAIGRKMLENA